MSRESIQPQQELPSREESGDLTSEEVERIRERKEREAAALLEKQQQIIKDATKQSPEQDQEVVDSKQDESENSDPDSKEPQEINQLSQAIINRPK
jgi:hypothetical protein